MQNALKRYLAACKKHNKCAGIHIVRPEENSVQETIDQGYRMIALGVDGVFLETASTSALKAAKS
jgi:2-keto-3-deoxy-L-rhamnonate aldolase RhmA